MGEETLPFCGEQYARVAVITIINKMRTEQGSAGNAPAPHFTLDDARKMVNPSIMPQKTMAHEELKERSSTPDTAVVLEKIVCVLRKNCRNNKPESVKRLSIGDVISGAADMLKDDYKSISRSWVANTVLKAIIRDKIISGKLSAHGIKKEYGLDPFACELLRHWGRDRKKR